MRSSSLSLLLWAGIATVVLAPYDACAQILAGLVRDQTNGAPVALARVSLVNPDSVVVASTLTNMEGYFLVRVPKRGRYWVDTESEFYWSHSDGPVALVPGDTSAVMITLLPHPVEMDPLVVEAQRRRRRMFMGGYFDRLGAGLGWHLDREQIELRAHFRISEALRAVPWITTVHAGYGDREPVFRRSKITSSGRIRPACYPRLFIDGRMFSPGGDLPTRLDRVLRPEDVEAIEVYESPWVPGRFDPTQVRCGVIAVWSR